MVMLFVICALAIGVLIMDIKIIQRNSYIGIKVICTILFTLSIMRYITLLLFARSFSLELLNKIGGFYFITIIGITIPFLLVLWYITPIYRQKINIIGMVFICVPWIIFYISILILKPFKVIKSQTIGYALRLTENWNLYLAVMQIIFVLILIIGSIYGWMFYKHKQTRGQYLILIMCQLLFLVDGLTYFGIGTPSIPVFTLTEVFGFLGIYYGFAKPPIDARGIQR